MRTGVARLSLCAALMVVPGTGQGADARRGAAFAQEKCATCHAIGRSGSSPNARSPTFREISRRYRPEDLEEAFAEGIVTGHTGMPEFVLSPRQIGDLTAHLSNLRRQRR